MIFVGRRIQLRKLGKVSAKFHMLAVANRQNEVHVCQSVQLSWYWFQTERAQRTTFLS